MAQGSELYAQLAGMAPAPDIQRMQAQAQALRQTPRPRGQMVGNRFVAPHWTQSLASTGSRVLGSIMDRKAAEQEQEYRSQLAQALKQPEPIPEGIRRPGYEPPSRMERLQGIAEENPYAQQLMLAQQMQGSEPNWQKIEVPTEQGVQMGFVDMNDPNPEDTFRPMGRAAPRDLPSSVEEYEYARNQGFQGTFQDYQTQKAQAGASNVELNAGDSGTRYDVGSIPQGYRLVYDEQGRPTSMEPITGGPAEREMEEADENKQAKQRQAERYADVVTADIDRAMDIVENSDIPVTGVGSYLSAIPGTPARDLLGLVDTIRANVGFDRLQQMRDASPTGGALGQVSELENRLLQATLGNLELSQSEEQFTRNLKRVKDIYKRIINEGIPEDEAQQKVQEVVEDRVGADEQTPPMSGAPNVARPTTEEEYNALPSGALFIDPDDGKTYRKP